MFMQLTLLVIADCLAYLLAVTGFVSSQPPYFRLIRKAVWGTMVTNNVCGSVILFISVQTKKGMSEDSAHRKPLLYLGA